MAPEKRQGADAAATGGGGWSGWTATSAKPATSATPDGAADTAVKGEDNTEGGTQDVDAIKATGVDDGEEDAEADPTEALPEEETEEQLMTR